PAHRHQRRARVAARGPRAGGRPARPGRAAGRDQLPLARGPDREAVHPRPGPRLHLPAGLPGVRGRARAAAAQPAPARGGGERRRALHQPALVVGPAAGRREDARTVSVAVSARAPARTRTAPEPAAPRAVPRRRVRARRMTAGGAVWVVILATLLGG